MSKELTPLQALNKIANIEMKEQYKVDKGGFVYRVVSDEYSKELKVIEIALKKLDKPKEIVGTTTVDKALEQFLIDSCPEVAKKLKALTLLDDCDIDVWLIKHCDYENYCRVRTLCLKATGNADIDDANREIINLPTEKEFDFLKEVLK